MITPGAISLRDGSCEFVVWAPKPESVELELLDEKPRRVQMTRDPSGYWSARVKDAPPGTRYRYILDREHERADPASRFQPEGPAGPSAVIDPRFGWQTRTWRGLRLEEYVIYELHVGTFTPEGTFDAIIPRLDELRDLGITAIELLPIAEFSGARNWGYDGVLPYAAHHAYGGPDGLRRLVDAAHERGLAIALDVVYNHIGPEYNYLKDFGPYFTEHYKTPWGSALNFDQAESDHVRRYFIENALYWITECHIDALRLDAVHAILDMSAVHFLEELGIAVEQRARQLGRLVHLIAESDLNMPRMVEPRDRGGYGMDAQWMDDFHHSLHVLLTREHAGYYESFGDAHDLAKSFREGYVYSGQYSSIRKRRHGRSSRNVPPVRFVVCAQNHDQIGNRMMGDRLAATLSVEQQKLSLATVLLSPYVPLLFMGEEYGDPAPFPYFISHEGRELVEAVRKGRREEFRDFEWQDEPPDPQSEETFNSAKLAWSLKEREPHRTLHSFTRTLLQMRRELFGGAATEPGQVHAEVAGSDSTVLVVRPGLRGDVALVLNFAETETKVPLRLAGRSRSRGPWRCLLDSADEQWGGPGSTVSGMIQTDTDTGITLRPWSAVVLAQETV